MRLIVERYDCMWDTEGTDPVVTVVEVKAEVASSVFAFPAEQSNDVSGVAKIKKKTEHPWIMLTITIALRKVFVDCET